MSKWARSPACLGGLVLLGALCASAQIGVPLNHSDPKVEMASVRELVARYCRMDYAGARLNPADWPKLQPMVAWRQNPDFSLFMVASRFDVENELGFSHGKYQISVRYRVTGKYDLSEGYSAEDANTVRTSVFTVSEVNGEWRISEIVPSEPYISRAAALQWINQKLAGATDPVSKTTYQQALQQLQAPRSAAQ